MSDYDKNRANESEEFRKYREQMHGTDEEREDNRPKPAKTMRTIFGIFMIIIYIGMGILCVTNWFGYPETTGWTIGRWIVGVVLIIYGIWRGYRQYAGIDSKF